MKPLHLLRCLVLAGPGLMAAQVSAQCEEFKLQGLRGSSKQFGFSVSWSQDRMAIGMRDGVESGSARIY